MCMPILIAGPCVIEASSVMEEVAEEISKINKKYGLDIVYKSSFDKANRTSITSYRGPGIELGLQTLADIKSKFGLKITTDIHEPWQAKLVAEIADIIQIPAFLCRQTDIIASAGESGRIINIKKGQFLSAHDMRHVVEKAKSSKCVNVWLTERGSSFGYNNLVVDFRNIPWMKQYADKVIMDCTHSVQVPNGLIGASAGNPEFIPAMAIAAKGFGADGFFFETHPNPNLALSDGSNMLNLDKLETVISSLL